MNHSPIVLSQAYFASIHENTFYDIHDAFCHPGITRLYHFARSKNLPYLIDDICRAVDRCQVCFELKLRFLKQSDAQLIKATQPSERLSLDFKASVLLSTENHHTLTIADEFSRFFFVFPCAAIEAETVILCHKELFSVYGMPSCVHSDWGLAFIPQELITFVHLCGV